MNLIEKNIVSIFLIFSIAGIFIPSSFLWGKNFTHLMLSFLAFCVGLTLKPKNFSNVWRSKKIIMPILTFKYTIIPIITFVVCTASNLPDIFTIGLVTLTCCPAANTGNILCYLSKGNTAMIIMTTIIGALISPFITPYIIFVLLNKIVHIDIKQVISLIFMAITLPMLAGILISHQCYKHISKIQPCIPSLGILTVAFIIGTVSAQNSSKINHISIEFLILCTFLITIFLSLGYLLSRFIKYDVENSIAMSYEMGTFDGVLGILLTKQIVGNEATLSVVAFAILNIIIGSIASKLYLLKQKRKLAHG